MRPPQTMAILLGLVLTLGCTAAQAQTTAPNPHAAQAERPTVATHAFTVASGWVELETGFQRQTTAPGASELAVPVLFKIGLGSRTQLDIAPGWQRNAADGNAQSGPTDLLAGLKVRLTDNLPVLGTLAVQGLVSLQTGSEAKGIGSGETSVNLLLISSHSFGPVAVDANVGYTRTTGNGLTTPRNAGVWCVSAGFPVAGPLGGVVEVFGNPATSGPAGEPSKVGFLTGPTLTLRPHFILDAGVIISLKDLGDTAVYGGVTWNLGKVTR